MGNADTFKILFRTVSKDGCIVMAKAMGIDLAGCFLNTTTQWLNKDGSYSISEALCFAEGIRIEKDMNGGFKLVRER